MEWEAKPPDSYADADPHDLVLEAQRQAREVLPQLPMSTMKELMALLSPATKKLRWYEGRYNAMQAKVKDLTAETNRLYEKIRILEQRAH